MKVVFLEDVEGVAQGGDVKEVKNGFARNYLIPYKLAVLAGHDALQRIQRLKKQADVSRLKRLTDVRALAQQLDGLQVNVEMRAGTGGRLYGSVTNIKVAEELSKLVGREIDRKTILLAEPIRELGAFDVNLRLHPEVVAAVKVMVHAVGTDPTADQESEQPAEGEIVEEEAEVEATGDDSTDSEGNVGTGEDQQ